MDNNVHITIRVHAIHSTDDADVCDVLSTRRRRTARQCNTIGGPFWCVRFLSVCFLKYADTNHS